MWVVGLSLHRSHHPPSGSWQGVLGALAWGRGCGTGCSSTRPGFYLQKLSYKKGLGTPCQPYPRTPPLFQGQRLRLSDPT